MIGTFLEITLDYRCWRIRDIYGRNGMSEMLGLFKLKPVRDEILSIENIRNMYRPKRAVKYMYSYECSTNLIYRDFNYHKINHESHTPFRKICRFCFPLLMKPTIISKRARFWILASWPSIALTYRGSGCKSDGMPFSMWWKQDICSAYEPYGHVKILKTCTNQTARKNACTYWI
jgi:hypothetical protein